MTKGGGTAGTGMKFLTLDQLEQGLLRELRANARLPNKTLAQRLGVSERKVAERIRSLIDRRVMHPTVHRDMRWYGYDLMCFVDVFVENRSVAEVAQEIADIGGAVCGVSHMIGNAPLRIHAFAKDRHAVMQTIVDPISEIRGVSRRIPNIVFEFIKFTPDFGLLTHGVPHEIEADAEINDRIIDILRADARISNLEVARQLNVSESQIRSRLRKLQEEKLVKIALVVDLENAGINCVAMIRLSIIPSQIRKVALSLGKFDNVTFIGIMSGEYDLFVSLLCPSQRDAYSFVSRHLTPLHGVRSYEVDFLMDMLNHRYDLVSLHS
jgi:Lrp/AsnC family transcriptional regulator for asnA, asnC and gidA